jgi:DNA-binding NarL/FixJ family response regulator
VDDARANVERAEAVAARGPLRAPVAHAQCARAELDNPELALQAAEEFDALGCAIEAARARLLAGSALGDVAWIERAEATFADHGAEPLRRRAAGALRALGKRPPQRAGAGAADGALAGLTDRQREISRLVADGRTNREIAERLVVTEKTVENHLARIFARLGVKSRTALTAVVVSEDS